MYRYIEKAANTNEMRECCALHATQKGLLLYQGGGTHVATNGCVRTDECDSSCKVVVMANNKQNATAGATDNWGGGFLVYCESVQYLNNT